MNRQITLAARPTGLPKESDFRLVESAIPSPLPGEALVRTLYPKSSACRRQWSP